MNPDTYRQIFLMSKSVMTYQYFQYFQYAICEVLQCFSVQFSCLTVNAHMPKMAIITRYCLICIYIKLEKTVNLFSVRFANRKSCKRFDKVLKLTVKLTKQGGGAIATNCDKTRIYDKQIQMSILCRRRHLMQSQRFAPGPIQRGPIPQSSLPPQSVSL